MHDLLDDYAHNNALREVSPRLKLLIGLISIILCVFSTSPVAPLVVAVAISAITVFVAKIPFRIYIKFLIVLLSFVLLGTIAVIFVDGMGDPLLSLTVFGLNFEVSREGANLALLLLSRTLGGMSSLFFIALTTPMMEIFSVWKSLGLPDVFIELSMLIYRYIFVLLDQAAMIHNAQVTRLGNSGLRSSLNSFSMLASVLFLRAWEQGERLMVAMDARCYCGRLDVMERDLPLTGKGILAAVLYAVTVTGLALLTQDFTLI